MNKPAFPTTNHNYGDGMYASEGMTLRDYFAAKAMQGLIASPRTPSGTVGDVTSDLVANLSYAVADAMLKARQE
jgi:hypothetical protein